MSLEQSRYTARHPSRSPLSAPRSSVSMKLLILAIFVAIVASLGSGLYYLTKDNQGSPRVLKALKIRVGLSALLVLFLLSAYFFGWIEPIPQR